MQSVWYSRGLKAHLPTWNCSQLLPVGFKARVLHRGEGIGGPCFNLEFFMPLFSIYSFQK